MVNNLKLLFCQCLEMTFNCPKITPIWPLIVRGKCAIKVAISDNHHRNQGIKLRLHSCWDNLTLYTSWCQAVWSTQQHLWPRCSKCGPPNETSAPPGSLLVMQSLRPHSRPIESESTLQTDSPVILKILQLEKHCLFSHILEKLV